MQTLSAGTLTLDRQGQVLLIRPADRAVWGIPKGHVDPGESPEAAAVRETHEEAGVAVELGEELNGFSLPAFDKVVRVWLASPIGDAEPAPVDVVEVAEARWFSIENLPRLLVSQRAWLLGLVPYLRRWTREQQLR